VMGAAISRQVGVRQGLFILGPRPELGRHLKSKNGQEGQKGAKRLQSSFRPFLPFLSVFALKPPHQVSPPRRMN
jgi:hypothetical protein